MWWVVVVGMGMGVEMREGELLMEEEVQGDGKCWLDRGQRIGRGGKQRSSSGAAAEQRKIFCIVDTDVCTSDSVTNDEKIHQSP